MKKLSIIIAIAAIALVSCSKQKMDVPATEKGAAVFLRVESIDKDGNKLYSPITTVRF